MKPRTSRALVAAFLLVLVTTGCGSSGDGSKPDDRLDTPALDGDIEIGEPDGDTTTTATDDDDGDGDGKTVPDGWPEMLAVPDGFTVEVSQARDMGDGRYLRLVEAVGDDEPGKVVQAYEDAVTAEGFHIGFQNDLNEVYQFTADDDAGAEVSVSVEESNVSPGETAATLKYITSEP